MEVFSSSVSMATVMRYQKDGELGKLRAAPVIHLLATMLQRGITAELAALQLSV